MTEKDWLENVVFWAGMAHFPLCAVSLYVPVALQWRTKLNTLQPLLRQMFWTYAAYILVINFSFGLASTMATHELVNGSLLAKGITLFIAIYWVARIAIQFFYFDRTDAPKGALYSAGEILLVACFAGFSFAYLTAFISNCGWL